MAPSWRRHAPRRGSFGHRGRVEKFRRGGSHSAGKVEGAKCALQRWPLRAGIRDLLARDRFEHALRERGDLRLELRRERLRGCAEPDEPGKQRRHTHLDREQ